jgi:hypothetical protein
MSIVKPTRCTFGIQFIMNQIINGLYMFRTLLAHLQEALHKQHLVYLYFVGVMFHSNPGNSRLTSHARSILSVFCTEPPEDEQVLETCRGR